MIVQGNDFAQQHPAAQDGAGREAYSFGTDKARAASALRRLAEEIERGSCLLQSARVLSLTTIDDYTLTTLRLVYHERTPIDLPAEK